MLSVNFDHRGQTLSNESRQRWQFHAILPAHTVLFKIWKLNFKRKVRVLPYYQAKLHNYSSSYPVSYLTISKPQHAENERCQQRFDAAKLPFWSLAASITAKWRTWHCVTKRFLKRNSAFHLDHVGMFCCFFFFTPWNRSCFVSPTLWSEHCGIVFGREPPSSLWTAWIKVPYPCLR